MTIRWLAVAGIGATLAVLPVAGAVGEDISSEAPVTGAVVYAYPFSEAAPTQALGIANPSVACILGVPCPPELSDPLYYVSDPVGVTEPVHGNTAPMEAVPPDTVAVSLSGGARRYEAALRFELPELPEGQEYTSFLVQLAQADPTYHTSSPAMRAAIDAAFVAYRTEDPAKVAAQLEHAITSAPVEAAVLDVQVCPMQVAFEPVDTPAVASHDDIPRDDFGAPQIGCHLGGFGEFDPETGVWSFDITRAANAWVSGDLDNNGVFLQPFITNYIGFGDEDPGTNAQVTFDATSVTIQATSAATSSGYVAPTIPPVIPPAPQDSDAQPAPPVGDSLAYDPVVVPDVAVPLAGVPAPEVAPEPDPVPAPAVVAAPSVEAVGAFAADDVSEAARLLTLLVLLTVGYGAHQSLSRLRPRPRLVDVDAVPSGA